MDFYENDAGHLVGVTKLFLIGYDNAEGDYREVDGDDDSLMAWRDAVFITDQLQRWSKEFDLTWDLSIAGEAIGQIRSGKLDAEGQAALKELVDMCDIPEDEREARIKNILEEYADRWDEGPSDEGSPPEPGEEPPPPISAQPPKPKKKGFWSRLFGNK